MNKPEKAYDSLSNGLSQYLDSLADIEKSDSWDWCNMETLKKNPFIVKGEHFMV